MSQTIARRFQLFTFRRVDPDQARRLRPIPHDRVSAVFARVDGSRPVALKTSSLSLRSNASNAHESRDHSDREAPPRAPSTTLQRAHCEALLAAHAEQLARDDSPLVERDALPWWLNVLRAWYPFELG